MILLVFVIVTTVGLLFAFARVFWRIRSNANDPVAANDKILRDLAKGSDLEVKEAIATMTISLEGSAAEAGMGLGADGDGCVTTVLEVENKCYINKNNNVVQTDTKPTLCVSYPAGY